MCCVDHRLCERCYGRELAAKHLQARVIGECWAERICRGELRGRDEWPALDAKALAIARRLVAPLGKDARLIDALAVACSSGAAAWWRRRPARYRVGFAAQAGG